MNYKNSWYNNWGLVWEVCMKTIEGTLKYVDLNSSNPTIKSTESTATCYGTDV